ncbi:hypothetical protein C7T35_12735 [Variovorax sp. WS11]|uniref:hypothetical protein n=1 Tax=Variovorax sp. WS11 TaxID=1105204 RepID=UPI000D0DFC7A|nr:hypothetical protein [Variovorax sp. WS11]NDZ18343.1 hypothetical protein [Variovorax sp. WS11]PSL84336.1 hypothetical protein C7T35_12735 [Variovorax sp. WS11]
MTHHAPIEDLDALRKRVALSTTFGWLVVSGVTATLYREKGEKALNDVWTSLMSAEQTIRFRDALVKLGIENDPPAIAAAKYHYFSNSIGGLTMQFIQESPRKAWIRYMPPWGSFPGIAALAVPSSVRRTILSTWHPRNGELLGCPRLGWVATKFVAEGHPYDEGYFEEYDHELAPSERMKILPVATSPEFDPAKAPRLDPQQWPEARILKGSHNYAADYAAHAIEMVVRHFGEQTAAHLVRMAMRFLAVQYTGQLTKQVGATECSAHAAARLAAEVLAAFRNEVELVKRSDTVTDLQFRSFAPFETVATEDMRSALFAFFEMATRVISGRFTARRAFDAGSRAETWTFQDHQRWMA